MPSLWTERYATPIYKPIPNEQWDGIRKAISENRKDIDKELASYALSLMATNPALAPLVPSLSKELGINPSADLGKTVNIFRDVIKIS